MVGVAVLVMVSGDILMIGTSAIAWSMFGNTVMDLLFI
jgi:hypothetical protein